MLALVLAAAFAPWMEWAARRRLPRALGAALAIMLLLAAVTLAVAFVVGSVSHQWHELAIQAQAGLERVEAPLQALPFSPDQRQSGDVTEQIRALLTNGDVRSRTLGGLAAIGDLGASLGLTVIILFFLLKDGPQMWEFLLRPLTGTAFDRAERIRRRTVGVFGGYIGSTAGAALFDAAGVFVGLLILRVPLAAPLAILTFLLAFIPIVGAVSAGAIAAMVALVTNGPLSAALVVLVVLVVDHVEGSVLKRARRARGRRRRRRGHRSAARRSAHCRGVGRRAGVGRRRPAGALGTPEAARSVIGCLTPCRRRHGVRSR
jgi:predicted PurR-regulated permease PerM